MRLIRRYYIIDERTVGRWIYTPCYLTYAHFSHDLELALRQADQLWLLAANGTLRQGTPEQLARDGALARAFAHEALSWESLRRYFNQPAPEAQSGQVPE